MKPHLVITAKGNLVMSDGSDVAKQLRAIRRRFRKSHGAKRGEVVRLAIVSEESLEALERDAFFARGWGA